MIIIFIIVLLILYIIIILITEKYNIYSKDDVIDMLILHKAYGNKKPPEYIDNYKFVEKTDTNLIYENNDIIKFVIRGTQFIPFTINDIITDIYCYMGINHITESKIYLNSIETLKKYKHKKIYLIGHSLGVLVANYIMNTYTDYNFIDNHMFSFFDGFEKNKLNDNIKITNFSYDMFALLSLYKYPDSNIIFYNAPFPISMYDSIYNHLCKYDNNNKIKDITNLNLIFLVIILIIFFLYINK
jgi:hypothetical protein